MEWTLLAELPEAERRSLLSHARRHRYAKGEVVFHEGDPAESLHLVERGRAAVRLVTQLGDVHIVRVVPPGGWFGELALITRSPRNATVAALEPGDRVAITEDVVSRGTSLLEAAAAVRDAGATPVIVVPVVDRGGTCGARCAAEGIAFRPLVTAPDLGFDYEGGD